MMRERKERMDEGEGMFFVWVVSSVVEHFVYTEQVGSSTLSQPMVSSLLLPPFLLVEDMFP